MDPLPELPPSSRYRSAPQRPIEEAEREQLNARLNEAFAAGGLEEDGYQQRLDQLYSARTLGELVPVVSGLPPVVAETPDIVAVGSGRPGELSELHPPRGRGLLVAVAGWTLGVLVLVAVIVALVL